MTVRIQGRLPGVGTPDDSPEPGIEHLWATFADAGRKESTPDIAAVEDAIFRHYLPWARSLAAAASSRAPEPSTTAEYAAAAEIGLAQAILAWRRTETGHFTDFARRLILRRLRRIPNGINHRRVYAASRPLCEIPLDAENVVHHDGPATQPTHGVEVALLDPSATIVWVNDVWKTVGEANGAAPAHPGVGMSYLAVCDAAQGDPSAELLARAIRRAASGQSTDAVTIRIPCSATDSERWYDVLVMPRTNEQLEHVGVAVALTCVSTTIWEDPSPVAVGT